MDHHIDWIRQSAGSFGQRREPGKGEQEGGVNGSFHSAPAGGTYTTAGAGMAVSGNGGTTSAHTSNSCDYPPAPSASAQPQAKSSAAGVSAASAPNLVPQLSQELGGSAATSTTTVDTTRAAAAKTLGFTVAGDQPVATIQMKGNFTAKKAKIPHGASVSSLKGSVINVVIEKSTGYVLDWGITNTAANLAALGKTITS